MKVNYDTVLQQISKSLQIYYGLNVCTKIFNGMDIFPRYEEEIVDGNKSYTIVFNPKVISILSLYNHAMIEGHDVGEAINRYALFNAFIELDDYDNARRQLELFRQEVAHIKSTNEKEMEDTERVCLLFMQIYFIICHEAFHIIFSERPEDRVSSFTKTQDLLISIKNDLDESLSTITNEELLSHPKMEERIDALTPENISKENHKLWRELLKKELTQHPYSTKYIETILDGNDNILLEEITCDYQGWLHLYSFLANNNATNKEILDIHLSLFIVFCAMDYNKHLQSQYRPSVNNQYNGNRVVTRQQAFKKLLEYAFPDVYKLITTQYLDLNKGLEAIFRSTVIGLQKYESDFRLLYQIDHTDLDRYNENLRNQLEDEMSVIVNLL